jgi:TP901 family phage tail tape measure protein
MDNQDLTLAMRLQADATKFVAGLGVGKRAVADFTNTAKEKFEGLNHLIERFSVSVGSIGVGFGAAELVIEAARTEKAYSRIGTAANASEDQLEKLRKVASEAAEESGQSGEAIRLGVDALVQSNIGIEKTIASARSLSQEMAITGAGGETLAGILANVSKNFNFDLTKPQAAVDIFERINAAGFRGTKQIENVAQAIDALGATPQKIRLPLNELLGLMSVLSSSGVPNSHLSDAVTQALRPFYDSGPMGMRGQAISGVKFRDKSGKPRDPLDVLEDIRKRYRSFKSDRVRDEYLAFSFGARDPQAASTLGTLMRGDSLERIRALSRGKVGGENLESQMRTAISHSVDQVGRLKAALGNAAEYFADKIGHGIDAVIKKGLDSKEHGGLGLSGGEIIGGGAALGVGAILAGRYGGPLAKRLLGRAGSTAEGIAEGKAIEKIAGVTPVFVVNMPGGGLTGGGAAEGALDAVVAGAAGGKAGKLLKGTGSLAAILAGLGGDATAAALLGGGVVAAGAAGYGAGTLINRYLIPDSVGEKIGIAVAATLARLGNKEAQNAVDTTLDPSHAKGTIRIEFDDKGKPRMGSFDPFSDFHFQLGTGPMMMGPTP